MSTIPVNHAVARLENEIEKFMSDDLIEVHNELFPEAPIARNGQVESRDKLLPVIRQYIQKGLEVEEVVDLWSAVFPKDRNVWYDEETSTFHFNEEPQRVEYSE